MADNIQKFIVFIVAYPMWVKIVVSVFFVVTVLILVFAHPKPIVISQLPADQLFKVHPVQSSGENCYQTEGSNGKKFVVQVHFKLQTKYDIEFGKVDLRYESNNFLGKRNVIFDNVPQKLDGSYYLKIPKKLQANSVLDVVISCVFRGPPQDHSGDVTVDIFHVTSPDWEGFRQIEITGKLALGGRLNDIKVKWAELS